MSMPRHPDSGWVQWLKVSVHHQTLTVQRPATVKHLDDNAFLDYCLCESSAGEISNILKTTENVSHKSFWVFYNSYFVWQKKIRCDLWIVLG